MKQDNIDDKRFSYMIEKRVRKHIRINKFFKKGDNLIIVSEICNHLIRKIIRDLPLNIQTKKIIPKIIPKNTLLVLPTTADDEACSMLSTIFQAKKTKKTRHVPLLLPITDKEAQHYSIINNITFKPQKKDKEVMGFVYSIQEKHPEVLHSLSKTSQHLQDILFK